MASSMDSIMPTTATDLTSVFTPSYLNFTEGCIPTNGSNVTNATTCPTPPMPKRVLDQMTIVIMCIYGLCCLVGYIGNGLVIFVVLRYAKMKTVTNMYILNLALADICFLVGVPFLITTVILGQWIFGQVICKLFYITTSINWFTSVFTLTVMSADRYLAVCHPVKSINYRTPLISRIVCVSVWTLSFLVMLPIILYAHVKDNDNGTATCTLSWPQVQLIAGEKAFIIYALVLGFCGPVALISVFYAQVVLRLRTIGPKRKAGEKRKSHKKVTIMVLAVITVYIVCWLPYWCFQVVLNFSPRSDDRPGQFILVMFQVFTVLSYMNSMANPILYAFLSENFRKSFSKAFRCMSSSEVNGTLNAEPSMFPGRRPSGSRGLFGRRTKHTDTGTETISMTATGPSSNSKGRNGLLLNNSNILDPRTTIMADKDSIPDESTPATQV